MTEVTPAWLGLSPVSGKARLGVAGRLPERRQDRRVPQRIRHGVAEMLRFRLLMIAAAYEDGNDANSLRQDPACPLSAPMGPNWRIELRRISGPP